jgi:hypothetical protein
MKLYKDQNNTVFAYELDGSQDHLIGNKTPITQEEADILIAQAQTLIPQPTPLTPQEKLASIGMTVEDLKTLLGVK